VEVLIYDEALRIEQADHLLVSYPCVYDAVRRRIATINGQGRQLYHQVQGLQLALISVELMRQSGECPCTNRADGIEEDSTPSRPASLNILHIKPFTSI
jgi:hypothetical protein